MMMGQQEQQQQRAAVTGVLRLSACASIAFLFLVLRHQQLATQQHRLTPARVAVNHDHHHPVSKKHHHEAQSFWDEASALSDHDDVMMKSRSLAEDDNQDGEEEETEEGPTHNDTTTPLHASGLPPAALQQWCPFAQCHVTNLCHPCRRRYLIVIATGRSGSTTLKEMLNALPGIRLSGENNGFLGHWMQALDATTRDARWKKAANKAESAAWFHHAPPPSAWACVTQQAVETLVPPPPKNQRRRKMVAADDDDREAIVGFKTIRFPLAQGAATAAELKRAVQFLTQQAFPCARIVINYRSSAAAQARSMKRSWKGSHRGRSTSLAALQNQVQANTRVLQELAQQLGPQRAFVLDSAAWTRNVTQLNELVSWLGFDEACHFDELFQFNTEKSYKAGSVTSRPPPAQCTKLPFS